MASVPHFSRHRLSVDQFQEMGRTGILPPDCRVELIDGELIDMAPINSPHASMVARLTRLFVREAGDAIVFPQNPINLPPYSQPQPDIAILAPESSAYSSALPGAADVLLVVEVAHTTLRYDMGIKADLYARHGIRELWVVDLTARVLEVFRSPVEGRYRTRLTLSATDTAIPEALPGIRVDLGELFRP